PHYNLTPRSSPTRRSSDLENNKKYYTHVGMKGSSTAFVITQALYAETKKGDKLEIVLLIDNLRMMQLLFIGKNLNSLFVSLINNEKFRYEVRELLKTKS